MDMKSINRIYYNRNIVKRIYKKDTVIWEDKGENLNIFNNILELKEADLSEGSIAYTKGYYTVEDNGEAMYIIMSYDNWYNKILPRDILYIRKSGAFIKTPVDEYGNHTLSNGLIAVLKDKNYTPEQWGAKGDGVTNDILPFIHMFAHVKTGEIKFRNKATYILGLTDDNPYREYMCGSLLGGQYFYKPIMGNVENLILDGNNCLITLPDNQFGDSGMGIFNFTQDIENLEIRNFNFNGKGKTMTSINKNTNHVLFYAPGQLYLNVLGSIGYEHYKYNVKYDSIEANASFKPSFIKNMSIYNNIFDDSGTIYSKSGDYGGDFILITNPTALDGLYIENNKFYNWGRWIFAIDLGGKGERLYNIKFNKNECLGSNRTEVMGSETWKWRALGLIDFEAKKCFTDIEICDNRIIGTAGWAFNGNSKMSNNIVIKDNHWEHIGGGYPYLFEWYSAQVKDVIVENNLLSGGQMKMGYTTHNLLCKNNRVSSSFRLLSISGNIIFDNNETTTVIQKLVSIDSLNEPTYLLPSEKICSFNFENNIGGLYGFIDKNSNYNKNYNLNFTINNNKSNGFNFNFFINKEFNFNPNQIDRENIREFVARGATFTGKTFSVNTIVAYGGGIYKKGSTITENANESGVPRTYFFANDKIIEGFESYGYNFTSYCKANGIKKLGVRCIEDGFIPSVGNWGLKNQETYYDIIKGKKTEKGAYIYTDDNLYYCINEGTLSDVAPNHIEGVVTNGDVQLLYITNIGKVEVYVIE